jgi:secondary thiamine-phosphate synthase enzyme
MHEISLSTDRRTQLVDITGQVQGALDGDAALASAALVFVPHTTAGVTINEHADPAVARDFESALERIVPADWSWQHVEEGEENAPTHIRASFMGPSVLIPLRDDGELALGTWQGVFFCEFDGPRDRKVYVTPLQ